MAIQIEFDTKVAELAEGAERADVAAGAAASITVREALLAVARSYPSLGPRLFNCDGELRSVIRVEHNGQPAVVGNALSDGDRLRLSLE